MEGVIGPIGAVGGPEQQYALKWNDFHSSILSSFRHLRDEEDFIDVTIACDGCSFTAHKVVLSACSPYFRSLLKANPCQHPIVIIRDVREQDMEALLRFMYNGEVHIGQEQLPDFLKTAQTLQVRGLADVSTKDPGKLPASNLVPWSSSIGNDDNNSLIHNNTRHDSNASSESHPPQKKPRTIDHQNSRYSDSPSVTHNGSSEHLDLKRSHPDNRLISQSHNDGHQSTPNSNQLKSSEHSSQMHSSNEDSNSFDEEGSDADVTDHRPNSVSDMVQPKLEPSDYALGDRSRNDSIMSPMFDPQRQRGSYGGLFNLQGIAAGLIPGPSGMHNNSQESFGGGGSYYGGGAAEPKPVCRECGRIYSSISNLKQHVANVHSTAHHWEPCPICGKHFKTRQYLFNHLLQTHGIRQRGSRLPVPFPPNLRLPPPTPPPLPPPPAPPALPPPPPPPPPPTSHPSHHSHHPPPHTAHSNPHHHMPGSLSQSVSQNLQPIPSPIPRISSSFHPPLMTSTHVITSQHSHMESNSEREVPHHAAVSNSQKERDLTRDLTIQVEQCLQFLSSAPR